MFYWPCKLTKFLPWEKFAETQYWHLALYAVYTAPVFMPIYFFSFALHSVWKLNKNALTLFWQKFRECNVLHKDSKELISRNIFSLKVNFLFFHTVHDWNFRTKYAYSTGLAFFLCILDNLTTRLPFNGAYKNAINYVAVSRFFPCPWILPRSTWVSEWCPSS